MFWLNTLGTFKLNILAANYRKTYVSEISNMPHIKEMLIFYGTSEISMPKLYF